ncbi:hypothetical protein D9611_012311 [Ephemerocybe angulata]|uniref:Uncharacterized protein n=1 Tax=Ephemerocybe angulata TaxID=980116 RepID=A0A8H5AT79_9AGAR|nr:hypothetical protein D9611_012311 [Tulosesus angulatus]
MASNLTENFADSSNDMRNVAGFAFGGKTIAGSTIYLHPPATIQPQQFPGDTPSELDCDLTHLPDGVVVHYYVNISGPVIARDVVDSIVCGTEHSRLPRRSRPAPPGRRDGRPEHFVVRNADGPVITSRVESSVIAYVSPGQRGLDGESALSDATGDPSASTGNPDADNEQLEPEGNGRSLGSNARHVQGSFEGRGQGPSDDVRCSLRERRLRNRRCGDAAARRKSAVKAKRRLPLKRITCTDIVPIDDAKVLMDHAHSKSM